MKAQMQGMLHHITVGGISFDGTCQIGFWRNGSIDNVTFHYVRIEQVNVTINSLLNAHKIKLDYVDLDKVNVKNSLQFVYTY